MSPNLKPQSGIRAKLDSAADILGSVSGIGGLMTKGWLAVFDRSPKWTLAATAFATVAISVAITFAPAPTAPRAPPFADQMSALDQTQRSLDQLSKFVEAQRESIGASQKALERLRGEQKRLEPLVQADRNVVDALLSQQAVKAAAVADHERWVGFGFGVIASLVASILVQLATMGFKAFRRRKGAA